MIINIPINLEYFFLDADPYKDFEFDFGFHPDFKQLTLHLKGLDGDVETFPVEKVCDISGGTVYHSAHHYYFLLLSEDDNEKLLAKKLRYGAFPLSRVYPPTPTEEEEDPLEFARYGFDKVDKELLEEF